MSLCTAVSATWPSSRAPLTETMSQRPRIKAQDWTFLRISLKISQCIFPVWFPEPASPRPTGNILYRQNTPLWRGSTTRSLKIPKTWQSNRHSPCFCQKNMNTRRYNYSHCLTSPGHTRPRFLGMLYCPCCTTRHSPCQPMLKASSILIDSWSGRTGLASRLMRGACRHGQANPC